MGSDDAATRAYYRSLPAKRIGAGLICRDADGRVLLVQPTYKPSWEIPGGVVGGESPAAAIVREVREDFGLDLPVGRLLIVDWLPVRPPKTERGAHDAVRWRGAGRRGHQPFSAPGRRASRLTLLRR